MADRYNAHWVYYYHDRLAQDNDECIVTELSGFIVAGKCWQLQKSMMNVLSS